MDRRGFMKFLGIIPIAGNVIGSEPPKENKSTSNKRVVKAALFITSDSGTYPFSKGDVIEVDEAPTDPFPMSSPEESAKYIKNALKWGVFLKGWRYPFNRRCVRIIELIVVDE